MKTVFTFAVFLIIQNIQHVRLSFWFHYKAILVCESL
jgi:hypothetical protein